MLPFQPPAIRGVGSVGGFQYVVEDVSGTRSLGDLAAATGELTAKANGDDKLRGVFTSFTADTPLLDVEVDRQKAKALGVPLEQVFGTMQMYMGSQYVNDFNYANRTYRVYLQAEQQFRDDPGDIGAFYVRTDGGDMIPLDSLVRVTPTTSAQMIRHYNLFRSAEVNGSGAPGVSSGQAIETMEQYAQALPEGMSAEWTGISLEQKESGGQTAVIFALGLLFVFLVLSAQYESFTLPFVVILSVPLAIFGALGLQALRGLPNDVFCQIGLVMLVGLASKNAILIVEFAEQLRAQGKSAVEAAISAGEVRLRPILMTSIAFLLGVVPLAVATGAGAAARNSLGTAVFGGMFVSTAVNLIFIPSLYVLVQKLRRTKPARASAEDHGGPGRWAPGAGRRRTGRLNFQAARFSGDFLQGAPMKRLALLLAFALSSLAHAQYSRSAGVNAPTAPAAVEYRDDRGETHVRDRGAPGAGGLVRQRGRQPARPRDRRRVRGADRRGAPALRRAVVRLLAPARGARREGLLGLPLERQRALARGARAGAREGEPALADLRRPAPAHPARTSR